MEDVMDEVEAGRLVDVRPLNEESPESGVVERAKWLVARAMDAAVEQFTRTHGRMPNRVERARMLTPEVSIGMDAGAFNRYMDGVQDSHDPYNAPQESTMPYNGR